MNKVFLVVVAMCFLLPGVLGVSFGAGIGINMSTEKFAPMVWMCDSRIVLDDNVEPGRISPNGTELIERIENYAFEGEQIHWSVLVLDKNGIEKVKDVYISIGPTQGSGNDIEANCELDYILTGEQDIEESCNARILEEELDDIIPGSMAYYDCTFTVETPGSMYNEYWVTVEAEDLDGLFGDMAENEFWFFNPNIALSITGGIDFGTVRPGSASYSNTLLVGNDADTGSGVLLDMYIAGTDFYDPSSSGAKCPTTNQLALTNFAYFATNGAYSTQGTTCDDVEGYVPIHYGNRIDQAFEIIGCLQFANVPLAGGIEQYQPGNVLSPDAEIAMTFRLELPEPCNGDFSEGSIFFWGEAV
ncbi:MAG: hypothetical protein V1837_00040 [Candidatus Woesearchaeota archaeon]